MHNSRIIIAVNPKFMINSQDLYFGITSTSWAPEHKYIKQEKSSRKLLQEWKRIYLARSTAYLCANFGTASSPILTHNISKICLKKSYIFQVMTNLCVTHLYFSCQNYFESSHEYTTKEVGFIILNPTKLVWDFSDFLVNF
jgi:hypothetical protein